MHLKATQSITGERVRLRPVLAEDSACFRDWLRGYELRYWMGERAAPDERKEWGGWAIERNHPFPCLLGHIEICDVNRRRRSAEVRLFIGDPRYRGGGLGGEAIRLLLGHVFRTTRLQEIYLRVYSDNRRAIRCYRRCGFRPLGRMKTRRAGASGEREILLMTLRRGEHAWINP